MEIKTYGYEVIEKVVKKVGTSYSVRVPSGWEGKKVKVIKLENSKNE